MKVKVITSYNDTQLKRMVKTGEEFEVTPARGEALISAKVAVKIEEKAVETADKKPQARKKKEA